MTGPSPLYRKDTSQAKRGNFKKNARLSIRLALVTLCLQRRCWQCHEISERSVQDALGEDEDEDEDEDDVTKLRDEREERDQG